jgi:SAM-dependent methyltransferase
VNVAKLNRVRFWRRKPSSADSSLTFVCNVCGASNVTETSTIGRETASCTSCRSILRWRSIVAALSVALYGRSIPLAEFPKDPSLLGLGTSDWHGYANRLSEIVGYENTFYDQDPRFDVMAPVPPDAVAKYDFILSSDVLEHVPPPYEQALRNLRLLLKPGGVLVLSVPMKPDGPTDEHFPDLHEYDFAKLGDDPVLVNRTRSGTIQVFEDLVFHEGAGATLEMRLFSTPDVLEGLHRAGFETIRPFDTAIPEHGIVWNVPATWPVVARAPQ